ncbi:cupin domain-containing protein [Streptomyces sp. NPDC048297]|uniref:cupin domain-containing protein n=1 Tax=Streptomyces sp. NPDC048297 TaxID=3365531 RepID=UPI00371270AB
MPQNLSPLVDLLGLKPHEGGWFKEYWRTSGSTQPAGYPGPRTYATAIYFLLHPGEENPWHWVRSDELWLWQRGGPLEIHFGGHEEEAPSSVPPHVGTKLLGPWVERGESPSVLVPGGVWQRARPVSEPVLVTCIVAPGFEFADFKFAPQT